MKILIYITTLILLFGFCRSFNITFVCTEGDECACELANLTLENEAYIECFSKYVCPYSNGNFCSGPDHGHCNFSTLECDCEKNWGSDDCSKEFKTYELSEVVSYGLIIIGTILAAICCTLHVWLHKYKHIGDVKAMSIIFTHLSLLGCTLITIHCIIIGTGYNGTKCVLLEWFGFVGITLLIGCTLLKAYRIANIFGNQSFSPSDLTDQVLLKYLVIIVVSTIFLLTLYTILNYHDGGAYYRYKYKAVVKEYRCSSKPLTMISYSLLVGWQLLLLLLVLRYGNQTRGASKLFKETKCIYVGSNIGTLIFITFGVFILFTTNYTLQISIRGFGSLIVVALLLYLLFAPKFNAVYGKKDDSDSDGMTEKDRALSTQYEANLKDRSGKELLLVLTSLIHELSERAAHKMLNIELTERDIEKCEQLLQQIHQLVPKAPLKQINSSSTIEIPRAASQDLRQPFNEENQNESNIDEVRQDSDK